MTNPFSRIVNLGLLETDSFVLRNRVRVYSTALLSIFLISCFYFTTALIKEYTLAMWITVYSILSMLLCMWLMSQRKFTLAYHVGMWYGFVFLSAFTFVFGAVTNSHYYFMFLPVVTNLLFDNRKVIMSYFIATVIIMLANVWLMDSVPPYYTVSDIERWFGYPNIPFNLLLVFLSVRLFKNENRTYAAQIEEQKAAIEEKNKEITDSINYAKRIQSALLAPESLLKKNLPEHFVLYKPKDIVSGDFYWATETSSSQGDVKKFWLCVGDCTGHGVPGAFMSLLNISVLNDLVGQQKIATPDEVLNRQRDQIIASLNPEGALEVAKDGMDGVLVKFDFSNKTAQFACANNPVIIVRDKQLTEFKADKQPVGRHEGPTLPFTLHTWQWKTGDCMYLFTDGYGDQFGGPKGKKFKYAQLKENIIWGLDHSMEERRAHLDQSFEQWRGHLEQVDDVLVIGIRLA